MIKIEHIVEPSPEQMEFVIEGMRNPMNSWLNSDSYAKQETNQLDVISNNITDMILAGESEEEIAKEVKRSMALIKAENELGPNDKELMMRLRNAGKDHRKFMRQMPIMMRITAPLYWWKEFDTYKVGTVRNSCSTMHKITSKEFTLEDFSHDHMTPRSITLLEDVINELNLLRNYYINWNDIDANTKNANLWYERKDIWWQIIQLLPDSYNQTANVTFNYEVAASIANSDRANHKQDEWRLYFVPALKNLKYGFLVTGDEVSEAENFDVRR